MIVKDPSDSYGATVVICIAVGEAPFTRVHTAFHYCFLCQLGDSFLQCCELFREIFRLAVFLAFINFQFYALLTPICVIYIYYFSPLPCSQHTIRFLPFSRKQFYTHIPCLKFPFSLKQVTCMLYYCMVPL